jgi:uncharacterized protein (DUF302 family)
MTQPAAPLSVVRPGTPAELEPAVTEALAEQGFGVLTRIDVTATLKTKIGADIEEYLILGACNPPLAHAALQANRSVGLLLPCNVVLRAEGEQTRIEAVDPEVLLPADDQAMCDVAADARGRLAAALAAVAGG